MADKKLTGRINKSNDVPAENDQLGENEYEAFRNAKEFGEEAKRKARR